jgi:hypothetical protein
MANRGRNFMGETIPDCYGELPETYGKLLANSSSIWAKYVK